MNEIPGLISRALNHTIRAHSQDWKYAFINVLGLAIGISSFLLTLIYAHSELTFDQFHTNSERIYRLLYHSKTPENSVTWARTGPGTAPVISEIFPEIELTVRILAGKNVLDPNPLVARNEIKFMEPNLFFADPGFFDLFSFESVDGSATDFSDPYSMVLTESTAQKYFGEEDPRGQVLTIAGRGSYKVVQVIKDIPANSHFRFDLIANFQSHEISKRIEWEWTRVYTYLLLAHTADINSLEDGLQKTLATVFSNKNFGGANYQEWKDSGNEVRLSLQSLESIHLHSNHISEFEPGGDLKYVKIFIVVGFTVLLLSCINFINICTAKASKTANSMSIKKCLGATRYELVIQFVLESIFICLLAALVAIAITFSAFPHLNEILGGRIALPDFQWLWIVALVAFIVFLGVLSGAYPAIYLTNPRSVNVRSDLSPRGGDKLLRKSLIVFQIGASFCLVVATLTIYHQVNFMLNKKLGFTEQLIVLERSGVLGNKLDAFKQTLVQIPGIASVSASSTVPGSWIGTVTFSPSSHSAAERVIVQPILTDYDFPETYELEIIKGRSFSDNYASDSLAIMLNETAMKAFGFEEIDGIHLRGWLPQTHPVVGVFSDFNQKSARVKVEPMVLMVNVFDSFQNISIRFSRDDPSSVVGDVERAWNHFVPSEPFFYYFLDDDLGRLYRIELETGHLLSTLSLLALLISSLGLYGLTASTTEQRGKEFAIRKVLGATWAAILTLLSRDFGKLILIAFFISSPLIWLVMEQWLDGFAYRSPVPLWSFSISLVIILITTAISIIGQCLKTVLSNPVDRLRAE